MIEDCIVVAAIEEERLNPTKHPNKAATRQLGDNESRESEEECSFWVDSNYSWAPCELTLRAS